jgi:hypothetical protein
MALLLLLKMLKEVRMLLPFARVRVCLIKRALLGASLSMSLLL